MGDGRISSPTTKVRAFTLIELSIVLVIIGLVAGGILLGRDLIAAAAIRAQINQIQQYQQAVNAFRGKYSYLPGDIPDPDASNFGFKPRGFTRGQGNGDGKIECAWSGTPDTPRMCILNGEAGLLWSDLASSHFIENSFPYAVCCSTCSGPGGCSPVIKAFVPSAAIGADNYIHVYTQITGINYNSNGINYFGISNILSTDNSGDLSETPVMPLSVGQASAIDKKVDDGFPQTGKITTEFPGSNNMHWSSGDASRGIYGTSDTSPTSGSSTTCYDNNNVGGASQQYSITQNNGAGMNCALSFKFQ